MNSRRRFVLVLVLMALAALPAFGSREEVPKPSEFLGFEVGGDRNLADWDQITAYFKAVAEASKRVELVELGKSTGGRSLIAAYISSEENISALPQLLRTQKNLTYLPRQTDEGSLLKDHKLFLLIDCSIHSTEIGASQMSMELLYRLATGTDPDTAMIRERMVVILIPSPNPDGIDMVVEWYKRWLGTQYEGCQPPWIYHEYAGHDNNRDWYMLNLAETRVITHWLYEQWFPQVIWDAHQMGDKGPRAVIPPHADPPNPFIHPLALEGMAEAGHAMKLSALRDGRRGIAHGIWFTVWWNGGFRTTPYFKNAIGLLTELASAKLATPVEIKKEDLKGQEGGESPLDKTVENPAPWEGGRWGLPEIVGTELALARGLLVNSARNYKEILENYRTMCLDAREAADGGPAGYLLPRDQRDIGALKRVVEIMRAQGIDVAELAGEVSIGDETYPAGTLIISGYQPYRPFIRSMFERVPYPAWNMDAEGNPRGPYDLSGWTLSDQFGLVVKPVEAEQWKAAGVEGKLRTLQPIENDVVTTSGGDTIYPAGDSDSFPAVNELLKVRKMVVRWTYLGEDGRTEQNYDYYNPGRDASGYDISGKIEETARNSMKLPRLGLLRGYLGSIDEGWTRYLLERFGFPYESLDEARVKAGNLRATLDAIILPEFHGEMLVEGRKDEDYPPEFRGGIGEEGITALDQFVQDGGTLICLTGSCRTMIEKLKLPVVDVLKDVDRKEFSIPGSLVRLVPDLTHPLAFGMDNEVAAMFQGGLAFEAAEGGEGEVEVAARYADKDLLISGFARGWEKIAGKAAVVNVNHGKGRVVLIGFPCQFRAQPYATFKLLFNAIYFAGDKAGLAITLLPAAAAN
jgi:hypothetical protein